jgi:hypothetical protein
MGISIAHVCGRGRGASGQMVTAARCTAMTRAAGRPSSPGRARSTTSNVALGWRVDPVVVGRTVKCPEHSGVEPTVDVQQELAL